MTSRKVGAFDGEKKDTLKIVPPSLWSPNFQLHVQNEHHRSKKLDLLDRPYSILLGELDVLKARWGWKRPALNAGGWHLQGTC